MTYLALTTPGREKDGDVAQAGPFSRPDTTIGIEAPVVDIGEDSHDENLVVATSTTPLNDLAQYKDSLQMGLDYEKDH